MIVFLWLLHKPFDLSIDDSHIFHFFFYPLSTADNFITSIPTEIGGLPNLGFLFLSKKYVAEKQMIAALHMAHKLFDLLHDNSKIFSSFFFNFQQLAMTTVGLSQLRCHSVVVVWKSAFLMIHQLIHQLVHQRILQIWCHSLTKMVLRLEPLM